MLTRLEQEEQYRSLSDKAAKLGRKQLDRLYRELALKDLYFLLVYVLGIEFAMNEWVYDRCREFEADSDGYLDLWPREHFKDLPLDTPMLTQNRGWTTHGDLVPGDLVFSPSGKPVRVIALSPRYHMNRCLKVSFQDGKEIICGEGHLWRVRGKTRLPRDTDGYRGTTHNERIVEARDLEVGDDIGAIEGPVEFPEADLPVHPYVLGAWLGDGHRASPRITCSYEDIDIPMTIHSLGYQVKEQKPRDGKTGVYAFGGGVRGKKGTGVYPLLRGLGVTKEKHIPDLYKMASVEQRMALLNGLMDTDGTCNERGNASFCNSSERLARDVYELAVGLAMRPRIAFYWTTCNGKGRFPMWVVSFQAHRDRNPFLLHRKERRAIPPTAHRECRKVVSVVEVDPVDTSCIQVEGGMYLAGRDLIPTHNSTIITLAAVIQAILKDPEITVGIFSFNRPAAKGFLRVIKWHFESNARLRALFPDILWDNPEREAPKWSEDDGIIVKRQGLPKEATIEASGVIDGMPTGRHYALMVYDDVETANSVSSPEMVTKTTEMVSLSFNLGREGGRRWMVGTIYHFASTYHELIRRGAVKERKYAATKNCEFDGEPWLWSPETLRKKIRDMGTYVASCQLFNKPVMEGAQTFRLEWLQYWIPRTDNFQRMNRFILVDPAGEKKKDSDYTVMWVYGLGADQNFYTIDVIRDKLSLSERGQRLFALHAEYKPILVGYEKYGMQADIEYLKLLMEQRQYRFRIEPIGGPMAKRDRIRRLQPIMEAKRFYLPEKLMRVGYDGKPHDLVQDFINDEYLQFPYMTHDDMLDCASRIFEEEIGMFFPSGGHMDSLGSWVDDSRDEAYEYDTYAYLKQA